MHWRRSDLMDKSREIRYLYTSSYMIVSLLLAMYLDPEIELKEVVEELGENTKLSGVGLAVIVGALLLPLGFAVGTVSIFVLRLLALIPFIRNYESVISEEDSENALRQKLNVRGNVSFQEREYIAAAFDHGVLSNGHQAWMNRRWNAFNLSLHSGVGLILVQLIVWWHKIHPSCPWYFFNTLGAIVFIGMAVFAWRDTFMMNNLLSKSNIEVDKVA